MQPTQCAFAYIVNVPGAALYPHDFVSWLKAATSRGTEQPARTQIKALTALEADGPS